MSYKTLITIFLIAFLYLVDAQAQTTITIDANSTNTVVQYIKSDGTTDYAYTSFYQIGRKDGSNPWNSGSQKDIYRTQFKFLLGTIPSNATLTQVKLNYSTTHECGTCKFKVTQPTVLKAYGDLWSDVGSSTALESDLEYTGNSRVSTALLNAVNSARSSGHIYLGALSQNENANLTEASLSITLEITYTVPASVVNITAQNNFTYGTIKVGVNGTATQRTSPYSFSATVGNTVNLEAQEQSYVGYNLIWNDTEAPVNLSQWDKITATGSRSQQSQNISYSFTAADNDNNSTYEAGLRKICNVDFKNNLVGFSSYGTVTVNGTSYNSPTAQFQVVEQNAITVTANSYYFNNGIEYTFSNWNDGSTNYYNRTIYPTANFNYTANYIGKPTNNGEYINFGTVVGQPIVITWADNPNTNVTQYQIWRKVKHNGVMGNEALIASVNRGVKTYTDYDYLLTSSYTHDLLYYDVRAYYSVEGTYSATDYAAVYGQFAPSITNEEVSLNAGTVNEIPTEYAIGNFPNPFNPTTTIKYQLPEAGMVTLKVYDILGREVAALVNENKSAGYYEVNFDASRLTSGVYIYTIQAGKYSESKKMILTK